MRVKRIKGAYDKVKASSYVLKSNEKVNSNNKVHLEIGSGKGQFIFQMAKDLKDDTFIAVEKYSSVCYRILQKQEEHNLSNLYIINDNATNLLNYINKHSVDIIYLNFSDPWPKLNHHKRRLTYPIILKLYKDLLKQNGKVYLRTDSLDFFNDSIKYFKLSNFNVCDIIHMSSYPKYISEYEEIKRKEGPIYSLVALMEA